LALLVALTLGAGGCGKDEPKPPPCTSPNCNGACVDFDTSPANCGSCGAACAAGQICVDGGCGPSGAVAPYVSAVSPTSAANGATRTVSLTGQRFQAGAQVVVLGAGAQAVPATFADSGNLSATLNLTSASPGASEIRVVNPDNVISNGAAFDVTLAAPVLTALACQDPGAFCVPEGGTGATTAVGSGTAVTVTLVVSGTGLVPSSQCRIASVGFPEMGLPSTLSGGQLRCQLDLRLTHPATYDVTVVNGGVARSNVLGFTVLTATPVLTAISPTAAQGGQVIALVADGSGFDGSSEVLVDGQATFNGSAIVTSFVSGARLNAQPVDLRGLSAGTHSVTVRNGALQTSPLTFTVTQAAPQLATVSPTSARQGTAVTLQATGANFDASTKIELQAPGAGTFTPIAATTVISATQASAAYTFGQAGSWLVRVSNGAGASGPLAVRVLSNVAVLSAVSPVSAQQGQTVNLSLTAGNLDPGGTPTVHLASASLGCPAAPCSLDRIPTVSGSTLTVAGLSLAAWDAGTFAVTVVNAGAQPSNSLGFTATPGTPTVAGVSPTCAVQNVTPVAVTLTGTNFAKPDGAGNGGSAVHAASESCATGTCVAPCTAICAVPDFTVPGASVTVVSPTRIDVSFDTTLAVPDIYRLSVWNPGPTILKSSEVRTFTVKGSGTCP
jgi:hypothetical protein